MLTKLRVVGDLLSKMTVRCEHAAAAPAVAAPAAAAAAGSAVTDSAAAAGGSGGALHSSPLFGSRLNP